MKENNVKTIPILKDEELVGVISTGDIATSYMDVYDNRVLSDAKTQYKNIIRPWTAPWSLAMSTAILQKEGGDRGFQSGLDG